MCGIIGCVGHTNPVDVLMDGLERLEYRGYDSAGLALSNSNLDVLKCSGKITQLRQAVTQNDRLYGNVGIGHTRWSTHGPPSDVNAHPHTDCTGQVAVVHNGILENHQSIREDLVASGHTLESDTDSEVVPHLIEEAVRDGASPEAAFRHAVDRLEGSYALAAVFADEDEMYATRMDSPLVLGIGADAYYLASDIPAFLKHTDHVVYLEDDEFVCLSADAWTVTDDTGVSIEKPITRIEWDAEETAKSGYDHYMFKEIHEQPKALRECLRSRVEETTGTISLDGLTTPHSYDAVQFVACGTSYHAALYGAALLREHDIPVQVFLASEYATSPPPLTKNTLVIGITQSGETADTLSALRTARDRGDVRTLAVTNVVGSTVARECDDVVYIRAGPEIGVAATKTFSSQVLTLNLLALAISPHLTSSPAQDQELLVELRTLPQKVQTVLDTSRAERVAESILGANAYFFIGRRHHYPVALEGALKFKEVTYEHAEGFASGELKHGPLALITDQTPVFATVTGTGDWAQKTVSNVKEVEARGAPIVPITDGQSDVDQYAEHVLEIPKTHPRLAPILANVQLQLVAYHAANKLGRSIDKPRNLAKSVTVE